MTRPALLLVAAVALAVALAAALAAALVGWARSPRAANAAADAAVDPSTSSASAALEMPAGYRDWTLVSVAREEGELNDLRAILGNDIAIAAYRAGTLPFPDGAIIARLAWSYDASEENNRAFGRAQSFVAGAPRNGVQFMVRDSRQFAATGGWGFLHFDEGRPADAAMLASCFPCHTAVPERDLVFTRYSR